MKQKTYLCIKCFLTSICAILFILHSYKEIGKFFSNMTSISIQTVTHVDDIQWPQIVVCLKEPFKGNKSSDTLEEFREMTYSYDEIFGDLHPNVSQASLLTERLHWMSVTYCLCSVRPSHWPIGRQWRHQRKFNRK